VKKYSLKKGKNMNKLPIVTIEMENGNKMIAELYPEIAPNTVNNFISLIQKEYYDGLVFHRVIPGFMLQGGCPDGTGMGGPGYQIHGEFSSNGFKNDLKHAKGILSMARSQMPDSAGSQFFVMHEESPHLDGQYAAFGKIIENADLIDIIAAIPTDSWDRPTVEQKIKKITVNTKNTNYPEPEKC
jgi:peptidyl-prolyl cis-trans isomerase B (cyclophilin B)